MSKKDIIILGYEYDEDEAEYLVDVSQGNRAASFTVSDAQIEEDPSEEEIIEGLHEILKDMDLAKKPRLEDASAITQYLVHQVEEANDSMYFLENNPRDIAYLEEQLGKPWKELAADLDHDIYQFKLHGVIDRLDPEDAPDFLITAYGWLQSTFTVDHPIQTRNLEGEEATLKEIAAGLSTENSFDLCLLKLEPDALQGAFHKKMLSYEQYQAVKEGKSDLPGGIYIVQMPDDILFHKDDDKYPETKLPFCAGETVGNGNYGALYMEIVDGKICNPKRAYTPDMAYDYAHDVFNPDNEQAYSEAWRRVNIPLMIAAYGEKNVPASSSVDGRAYQLTYAKECFDTPNLLIDKEFAKQMIEQYGKNAGAEKAAIILQWYSPQAVLDGQYGQMVAQQVRSEAKTTEKAQKPTAVLITPIDDSNKKVYKEKLSDCATLRTTALAAYAKGTFTEEQVQKGFLLSYTNMYQQPEAAVFVPNPDNKKEWIVSAVDENGWKQTGTMKKISGSNLKIIQAASGELKQQTR